MSRVHLGMIRPIRQFNKHYKRLLELVEDYCDCLIIEKYIDSYFEEVSE